MKAYTAVLLILTGILTGLLFLRSEVEAKILRLPGQLFEHKGENISNVYTFKIVNKTAKNFEKVTIKLENPKGEIKMVGKQTLKIEKEGVVQGTLFIEIHPEDLSGDKTKLEINVYNGNELIDQTSTNFLGPRSFN